MKYTMTTPCSNCPFRHDKPFPLLYERVWEIAEGLVSSTFACHKTTEENEEGELEDTENSVHCAGALILLEKNEMPSQMMRVAERLGLYDKTKLDMNAPVYDDWDEMAEACDAAND